VFPARELMAVAAGAGKDLEEETAYVLALLEDYKNLDAGLEPSSLPDSITLGAMDGPLEVALIGRSAPSIWR
jgi:hypothetical protein